MKIARYIGDLLYDYECVVIPGLGGFLTHDKPASIQPNAHYFRPPYKQVMFNAYLKTNDGLLVNYIAREENISYKEAKAQVDKFVYLCDNALKSGKRINFHKVGSLYLNKNGKIVFEQDSAINYNADAFGLTSFVSPAIRRDNAEEKLRKAVNAGYEKKPSAVKKTKKQDRKALSATDIAKQKHEKLLATRTRSPYKTQAVFLVSLIIAMMIGWGFMNKDVVNTYYNNYSSVIPLFYSQPNAYMLNNMDKIPVAKVSNSRFGSWWISLFEKAEAKSSSGSVAIKKNIKSVVKVTPPKEKLPSPVVKKAKNNLAEISTAKNKTATTSKAATKIESKKMTVKSAPAKRFTKSSRRFYIIAGAFKDMQNVKRMISQLKQKGYRPIVVGTTRYGFHRVAFDAFDDRLLAEKQLAAIRKNENPAAWLLIK